MALIDQYNLSNDANFVWRVRQAIIAGSVSIQAEAGTVAYHAQRAKLAASIVNDPASWAAKFAMAVANDATVVSQAGTPATQANVTDAAINAALNNVVNAFFSLYA